MWRVGVVSSWVVDGGRNRAKVFMDYAGQSLWDVSGTDWDQLVPDENIVAVEGLVDDDSYAAMLADVTLAVVWAEEVVDG